MPDWTFDGRFTAPVAGCDEVGRGCLAGVVVAAAVVLPPSLPPYVTAHLHDSKTLTEPVRDALAAIINERACTAFGIATPEEIDRHNILSASLLAMQRAVSALAVSPQTVLVDGRHLPALPCEAVPLVKGDSISPSIAAASVVAKVHRDALMRQAARQYPVYGWQRNVGYPTAAHRAALLQHGVTPLHRRSFAPVRRALEQSHAALLQS